VSRLRDAIGDSFGVRSVIYIYIYIFIYTHICIHIYIYHYMHLDTKRPFALQACLEANSSDVSRLRDAIGDSFGVRSVSAEPVDLRAASAWGGALHNIYIAVAIAICICIERAIYIVCIQRESYIKRELDRWIRFQRNRSI